MSSFCVGIYFPKMALDCRKNQVCMAQSKDDQNWYRAMATNEVKPNVFKVMFIDYGNSEEVPVSNIREITSPKLRFPCMSVLCIIDGSYFDINICLLSLSYTYSSNKILERSI